MNRKTLIITISAVVLLVVLFAAGGGRLILIPLVAAAYFAPLIVGYLRKAPNVGSIAVVNFFFGWSGIGWIIALVMAMKDSTSSAPVVHVVVNNTNGETS